MFARVGWLGALGFFLLATPLGGENGTHHEDGADHGEEAGGEHHGVVLASWRWDSYGGSFLCTLMLILCVLVKIGFHYIPFLSKILPESCFLILLGIALAGISYSGIDKCDSQLPKFTADLFFNILLPPIILDSSFALYDRDFLVNFRSVVTFAVVGTIFNMY